MNQHLAIALMVFCFVWIAQLSMWSATATSVAKRRLGRATIAGLMVIGLWALIVVVRGLGLPEVPPG